MIETPTLPTASARSPAARRIDSSIRTVVVLPFVPVTASHGAASGPAQPPGELDLADHLDAARRRPTANSGWSGRQPGEVTTRSTPAGSSVELGRRTSTPVGQRLGRSRPDRSTSTRAPRGEQRPTAASAGEPGAADQHRPPGESARSQPMSSALSHCR